MSDNNVTNENRFNCLFGSQSNFMNTDFTPSPSKTPLFETTKDATTNNIDTPQQKSPESNNSRHNSNLSPESDKTLTHPALKNAQACHGASCNTPNNMDKNQGTNASNQNIDISNKDIQTFLRKELYNLFEAEKKKLAHNVTPPPNGLQRNIQRASHHHDNYMANMHSPICTKTNSDNNHTYTTQGTHNLNNSGPPPLNQTLANNLANEAPYETESPLQALTTRNSPLVIDTALNNNTKTAKKNYKPKNPLLLPLKEVLASQLQPIRKCIEQIALKNLQDTKEVYHKTKVLQLWTTTNDVNNNNNTPTDNNRDDSIKLPENTFIPKSINLKGVHLGITKTLQENDDYRIKLRTITNKFEKIKNKFLLESSHCAKEVAELKLQLSLRNRSYNIAKGFLTLTHFTALYHIKLNKNEHFSTKPTDIIAGCILIKFIKYVQKPFFEWLKIDLPTLTKQIISIMGDCLENSADIINNPICGRNETKLYTHVKQMLLTPIFENTTFKLAEWHKNKNEENFRKKQMYSIIKTNNIEKITEATKNGLDNLELDEKGEKLISHITSIVSKMESNLNHKITNNITKNLLGAEKKHPPCEAKKEGPQIFISKTNKKRKNGYIHKNKQKTRRANNNHKVKFCQHTTTNYLRKQNKRGYQEGTHKEAKRDKNKKSQKP